MRDTPGAPPDCDDFRHYADDLPGRIAAWQRAVDESQRLRDEFAALVERGGSIEAQPL